jgi:hypothetical protein
MIISISKDLQVHHMKLENEEFKVFNLTLISEYQDKYKFNAFQLGSLTIAHWAKSNFCQWAYFPSYFQKVSSLAQAEEA